MFNSVLKNNDESKSEKTPKYEMEYVWTNILALLLAHLIAVYGLHVLLVQRQCKIITFVMHFFWTFLASLGITAGAHRLWAHKSYKAKTPLRVFYAVLMSMNFANDIYTWARDHRAHHKYTETDADPHNSNRGFFFAHMGWLMVKKHPDVKRTLTTIDYADLKSDPVVNFHRKYYGILMPLGTFILPSVIPSWFWGQSDAFPLAMLRYIINIHIVWGLNSISHLYGTKPYDKNISPVFNNVMAYLTIGEGFHNYHHTFPWDYRASEMSSDPRNFTTSFIRFCARRGWAYDLKSAKPEIIKRRALRCGDGTWVDPSTITTELDRLDKKNDRVTLWGWDDPDLTRDCEENAKREFITKTPLDTAS